MFLYFSSEARGVRPALEQIWEYFSDTEASADGAVNDSQMPTLRQN